MLRPALALGLLLAACGDGPPERKLRPPPDAANSTAEAGALATTSPGMPATPDTPAARELLEICLTAATLPPAMPAPDRFRRALTAAETAAVSPDSKALVQRLHALDLAEAAADVRRTAAAAGVLTCPLADSMDAVATAVPNITDALALISVLEALTSVSPEYKDRILAAGCSEMPACGRECSSGLAAVAEAEPTQRVLALMRECAAFRAQATTPPASEAAVFAWIRARVATFADASADLLPPADAARLAQLRKPLQL